MDRYAIDTKCDSQSKMLFIISIFTVQYDPLDEYVTKTSSPFPIVFLAVITDPLKVAFCLPGREFALPIMVMPLLLTEKSAITRAEHVCRHPRHRGTALPLHALAPGPDRYRCAAWGRRTRRDQSLMLLLLARPVLLTRRSSRCFLAESISLRTRSTTASPSTRAELLRSSCPRVQR